MTTATWHTALTAAHHAARRDFPVFPLGRTKKPAHPRAHPDKAPHCRGECGAFGHGVHDATTNPATLDALFQAVPWATGYGIACGQAPHHLAGIDLDVKNGIDGPANFRALAAEHRFTVPITATVATPSGGWHLWLATPPGAVFPNSVGKVAPGMDVRGPAGYLVGPGSRTAAGVYRFAPGTDPDRIAPIPPALIALLTPPPAPPVSVPDPQALRGAIRQQSAYVAAVLDREAATVAPVRQPGRGKALFAASARVGRHVSAGTIPERLAFDALLSAGLATGLPLSECERTITRGFAKAAGTLRAA
ncbi:bifunctional DNA primase/polymerase [Kitasatospora sp. NBC_00070]|uniref:bifunctional DNA primase/polymerase n=1 Tax=Kitasatospora sp. NBC_00070 TaxID=2975962 RepID=UPI003254B2D3